MKVISDYESVISVNPLYFIVADVDGYIEETNGNKYLVFAYTEKNKEVQTKYTEPWHGIKNLIKTIDDKPNEYGKDFIKIKFNSDNNLPLNRLLKLCRLTITIWPDFQEDKKYYPQFYLDECLQSHKNATLQKN